VCFHQGSGKKDDGWCADCAYLKGAVKAAEVAVKVADLEAKKTVMEEKEKELQKAKEAEAKAGPTEKAKAAEARGAAQTAFNAAKAAVEVAKAAVAKAGAPTPPIECQCKQRWVLDVHVATSNGISNHLLVEVPAPPTSSGTTPAQPITT